MKNVHKLNEDGTATLYVYGRGKHHEIIVDADVIPLMTPLPCWTFDARFTSLRATDENGKHHSLKHMILGGRLPPHTKVRHINGSKFDYRRSNLEAYGAGVDPFDAEITDAKTQRMEWDEVPFPRLDYVKQQLALLRQQIDDASQVLDDYARMMKWD